MTVSELRTVASGPNGLSDKLLHLLFQRPFLSAAFRPHECMLNSIVKSVWLLMSSTQRLQKLPGGLEIGRLKSLCKASIDGRHRFPTLLGATLPDSKPCECHSRAQFPRQCTLPTSLGKS